MIVNESKRKQSWLTQIFLSIFIMITCFILFFNPATVFAKSDYNIRLKSRQFIPPEDNSSFIGSKLAAEPGKRVHVFIQFHELPNAKMKKDLEGAGVKLLSYIPNNAWLASIPKDLEVSTQVLNSVRWVGKIQPEDKISPKIVKRGLSNWALNESGTAKLNVKFFKDVSLNQARRVISSYDIHIIKELSFSNVITISAKPNIIEQLALEDTIQWITEIPPPKELDNDGARISTNVDVVNGPAYNLNGTGVVVGVWDGGEIDDTHDDFGNRVTLEDAAGVNEHATHVAGIIGGDGSLSESSGGIANQWRGVADIVDIISYDNNGDFINEYQDAISTYNMDISNNSWGYIISDGQGNCDSYGDYSNETPELDDIVRTNRIAVVFSAGNERNDGDCGIDGRGGYSCIGPLKTAKNIITVGAINSNDNSMTTFSSWGPVDDGRIKPDLVAPGCEDDLNRDDDNPNRTIWSTIPGDTYHGICGTSMAAPVVSGITALIIEEFRKQTGIDPLPSTVRAILINTALDLGNTGPDYTYGFGKVDARAAVDAVIAGNYGEGSFDGPNGVENYTLSVPSGTPELQ